ncbi:carbonic anhydrase 1 [Parasteatoda tepidariorum]|uniref:carbonic anhydrase 1 n=1 Tax=Parasteatoda tepidariorum TaxID=114398 RepID=UPI00077FAC3B|nr:carbonic anhydrase 1 [Parasteatoda tepidariorum]
MQSHVVDIKTSDVSVNIDIKPLQLDNLNYFNGVLCKTQEGWKIEAGSFTCLLDHGPLKHSYTLYEIHGHMVKDSCLESCRRHSVDGKEYAGELHLLHNSFSRKLGPDELNKILPVHKTVICILLEEGKINNELSKFTNKMPELSCTDKNIYLNDVDVISLLPEKLDFWMYEDEIVGANEENTTWIIFKKPIEISNEQVNAVLPSPGRASGPGRPIQPHSKKTITEGYAVLKPSDS